MNKKIIAVLFLLSLLLGTEWIVRWNWQRNDPIQSYKSVFAITQRILPLWLQDKPRHPFEPPFRLYDNFDFDKKERRQEIIQRAHIAEGTYTATDFLLPEDLASKHPFKVTINSKGFRGIEYPKSKTKDTFRIVVLGSYHAFGHGVSDDETYSFHLSKLLSKRMNKNVEVINAGRHAGSGFYGWSMLNEVLPQWQPDMVLWDFGFVDHLVIGDDFFPVSLRFPYTGVYSLLTPITNFFRPLLLNSYLFHILLMKSRNYTRPPAIQRYANLMNQVYTYVAQERLPLVVIQQSNVLDYIFQTQPPEQGPVSIFKTKEAFAKYPPTGEQRRIFKASDLWTQEHSPKMLEHHTLQPIEYRSSLLHFNGFGHLAIAKALADQIETVVHEMKSE